MTTSEELKLKGNDYMKEYKYEEAKKCYEDAWAIDKKNHIIPSNLSEVHLKLGHYKEAFKYASLALELNPEHAKSLYRKLRALIGMKKYSEAYILSTNPMLNEIQNIFVIKKSVKEQYENFKGTFSFSSMLDKEKLSYYLNCGEYQNSKIKFDLDKSKGIKAMATHKIKKGEILIVSKAITFTPLKEGMDKTQSVDINKLYNISPEDNEDLLSLFDGKNLSKSIDQRKKDGINHVNEEKFNSILKYNQFETSREFFKNEKVSKGLWILPSFFNHSCLPNTYYFGIGDCFILLAQNDIMENTEILINYIPSTENIYETRQKICKEKWGFECKCDLCMFEKKKIETSSEKNKMNSYMKIMIDELQNGVDAGDKLKDFLSFLDNNKKKFSCYEMCLAYVLFSKMKGNKKEDVLTLLTKGLRYAEGRFFAVEFNILSQLALLNKDNEAQLKEIKGKMEKCLNGMFPENKELTEYVVKTY